MFQIALLAAALLSCSHALPVLTNARSSYEAQLANAWAAIESDMQAVINAHCRAPASTKSKRARGGDSGAQKRVNAIPLIQPNLEQHEHCPNASTQTNTATTGQILDTDVFATFCGQLQATAVKYLETADSQNDCKNAIVPYSATLDVLEARCWYKVQSTNLLLNQARPAYMSPQGWVDRCNCELKETTNAVFEWIKAVFTHLDEYIQGKTTGDGADASELERLNTLRANRGRYYFVSLFKKLDRLQFEQLASTVAKNGTIAGIERQQDEHVERMLKLCKKMYKQYKKVYSFESTGVCLYNSQHYNTNIQAYQEALLDRHVAYMQASTFWVQTKHELMRHGIISQVASAVLAADYEGDVYGRLDALGASYKAKAEEHADSYNTIYSESNNWRMAYINEVKCLQQAQASFISHHKDTGDSAQFDAKSKAVFTALRRVVLFWCMWVDSKRLASVQAAAYHTYAEAADINVFMAKVFLGEARSKQFYRKS